LAGFPVSGGKPPPPPVHAGRRVRPWLALIFCLAALSARAAAGSDPLAAVTAADFTPSAIVSYPGAFRLNAATNRLAALCIPSNGTWRRAGATAEGCPIGAGTAKPPPGEIFKLGPGPEGTPAWVVGNLGIDTDQWLAAHAESADGLLGSIAQAASITRAGPAVRWQLDSASLPAPLHIKLPGTGLFFHMQFRARQASTHVLFATPADIVTISARLALPRLALEGTATTIVTLGVGLQTPDTSGKLQPISLIASVFNSRGYGQREYMGSDGRNIFIGTSLNAPTRFIEHAAGQTELVPGAPARTFAFSITHRSLSYIIDTLNTYRTSHGQLPLNQDLSLVHLKQLDIRNESQFADGGNVSVILDAGYIKAERLPGPN